MKIARRELEADADRRYVCVAFSPWLYEDYDDVKAALITAVLDKCRERADSSEAKREVSRLRRMPGLMRKAKGVGRFALGAAPAVMPAMMAAFEPSLADVTVQAAQGIAQTVAPPLVGLLEEPQSDDPGKAPIRDVGEFREAFAALVESLDGVDAVVVFVDDLDRCLPGTVIDTFEAIRLFLTAPRTAYVIAANRDVVETSVDTLYPALRREDGRGIGHDYLEKMLQLQVNVPPLSAAETETYVNLLVTQLHLQDGDFRQVCDALRQRRIDDWFAPSLNIGLAGEVLGARLTETITADLTWASEIAPALSELRGNPRQVKRFLNDLTWRRRAAARRNIDLRHDVLAKLMVLDTQSAEDFQTLLDWQLQAEGPAPELVLAEAAARAEPSSAPAPAPGAPAVRPAKKAAGRTAGTAPAAPDAPVQPVPPDPRQEVADRWAELPRRRAWLRLSPDLSEVDLRPYFSYFRDRLVVGTAASTLRPSQQALLVRLQSEVALVSRDAQSDLATHDDAEQDEVLAALLDATGRRPDSPLLFTVCELAGRLDRVAPTVCDALARIPHRALPKVKVVGVLQRLNAVDAADGLRSAWSGSDVEWLAKVATTALRPRPGR